MDYKKIIKNRELRIRIIKLLSWIPDKLYLRIVYKIKTGKKLNLKNPVGFNEKLNWLKIYNKNENLTKYVDKIEVRNIVKEKIGSRYLIPIYGSWDSFEQIDFSSLPNTFVLKCNHDSGSVKIIYDKSGLKKDDYKKLRKFFNRRLKINTFCLGREYPYKNVRPKIFAEKYIEENCGEPLKDYKFFCFNGEPKLLFIAKDRFKSVTFDFYDVEFNHLNIVNIHENSLDPILDKPPFFDEMLAVAKVLSKDFPFVRIDLYQTREGPVFGEYTFFHGGGFYLFSPEEWEKKLGDLIIIKKS